MPSTSLAVEGACALVVGTGTHATGSLLPDIPAVAATVTALGAALVQRCGLAEDRVATLTDPADPRALLHALTEAAAAASDVLLFYYVGHGLVSLGGELYLATSATTDQGVSLAVEALSYATVRDVLATCAAKSIVVVLDCCFSGRAYGAFGTAVADAFELSYVRGSFLLTAASATEQALAPPGEQYTGFSGALLGLLRDGDPAAPRYLSIEDAYRYLSRVLPQRGLPAPHRRAGDRGGDLILATNPLAPPLTQPRRSPEPADVRAPSRARPCPYPGLSPFTAADAQYFRGRDDLVADALATLAIRTWAGPAALIGPSGSGKSSLLQAGLLPAVRAGRLGVPGSADWPQLLLTPGEHPLRTLATRLAGSAGGSAEGIRARLAADPGQLTDIARRSRSDGLLVCVDQFEELFTVCADLDERRALIQALCAASDGPDAPLVVVLGMRADFYGHCMAYPELAPTLEHGQIPVRPMTTDQLRTAIEGPADTAGLVLESGLADRLLQDLAAEPDAGAALPLLSYALQATWQHSDGQLLTLADYQATGGIWQAVTQRADRTYDELDPAGQDAARLLLLRMVRLGEGTEDVRHPVSLADLTPADDPGRSRAVTAARDAFVGARLVTVADGEAEITHEALLRAWPRLRGWIDEDRSELLARQRLADAAHTWAAEGRERGALYSGARLELARRWLDAASGGSQRGPLSPGEREFLVASVAAERRGRSRRRAVAAAAIVVVLALAGTGVFALQQRAGNRSAAAEQSSVQLAAEADNLQASNPAAALELSLTAYSTAATAQARSSLYDSYVTPYPVTLPGRANGPVVSVAYSPDGTLVAGAARDGKVRLWRVHDPLRPVLAATVDVGHGGSEVAFSARGHLMIVHAQRALELWDVANPARPVRLSTVAVVAKVPKGQGQFVPLAVSPDGDLVATGNLDGRLRLWDIANPRHPVLAAEVRVGGQALEAIAFSPDGRLLATTSAPTTRDGSGQVRLYAVSDLAALAVRAVLSFSTAYGVAFSPVGHLLVAAGSSEQLSVWDIPAAGEPTPVVIDNPLTGGPNGLDSFGSIAFRPDGRAFVTADTSGQTYIWSAQTQGGPMEEASLPDATGTFATAFSPSGQQLVTGDLGGTVVLWTMLAPQLPGGLQLDWEGSSFGQHGTLLAVNAPTSNGVQAGQAALWNISDPVRPTRIALLPRSWPVVEFLPDGRTLLTANTARTEIRLWSAADPRHLVAGAVLPVGPVTSIAATPVAPSSGHLLLVLTGATLNLWNVRDYRHPVLEASIPAGQQAFGGWFLTSQLLGVLANGNMQLWDVANVRHPVREGQLRGVGVGATLTYESASKTLTAASSSVSGSEASIWDLANPRKPVQRPNLNADPDALTWINGQTMAAINADDNELDLWDVRGGRPTSVLAAVPIGSQSNPILQASSDGGMIVAGYNNLNGGPGTLQLWSVSVAQRAVNDIAEMIGNSVYFAFTPDGQTLATELSPGLGPQYAFASSDLPTVLYPVAPGAIYSQLCRITSGVNAGQGWRRYLAHTYYRAPC